MNFKRQVICIGLIMGIVYTVHAQSARFSFFNYEGNDPRFEQTFDPATQYLNPIVAGFYPDPSVCRKGDTYYLVNSTFALYPGVPIHESKDLVSWRQIGHVLDHDSQLSLQGNQVSAGIYAPDIVYNERNDTFYMVTMNMGNYSLYYVKTKDPAKGWSEPIRLKAGGMDPAFFFDTDGKGYLVYTTLPFGGSTYDGEMAVHINEFSVSGDSICSESVELVKGGTSDVVNPQWLEGPHIYHIDEYYYLMCAQGGTQSGHTEVIFRSTDVYGPYEECPSNPILTQHENLDTPFPVSSTGHADLSQTAEGDWWVVFLGCRPYEGDLYNTGRETFLLPVSWKDGWPYVLAGDTPLPTIVDKPNLQTDVTRPTGNFSYTDRFEGDKLDMHWIYLRNPDSTAYHLDGKGILIDAASADISQKEAISAIFRRQQHTNFTVTTEVAFTPQSEKDLAGFALLQSETHNIVFGETLLDGRPSLILKRSSGEENTEITTATLPASDSPVQLRIEGKGKYYSFSYRQGGEGAWLTLAKDVDASNLSTHVAGGFIGTLIGLYATAEP